MVAAVAGHPANKSNISFLVACYDLANLRQVLIPFANGNTFEGTGIEDCSCSRACVASSGEHLSAFHVRRGQRSDAPH